jgi:hypothetical protein
MFDDAFADFEGQIQATEGGVALLEILHDAQRMQVVIEKEAVSAHGDVEGLFSGVAEGRMADIMDQSERLGQVDVEAERSGDGAGDLRDFDGVSEAVAEVVGVAAGEDLGFRFKTTERSGVDNAITVALKIVAVGMLRLGITASAGLLHPHGVVGEHEESLTEAALSN